MRLFQTLSPQEVWERIQQHIHPLPPEQVPLAEGGGRICAEKILAPEDLPAFNRSAVDGYAVLSFETFGASEASPALLNLAGEVRMGEGAPPHIPGSCYYVPTGAMLPEGSDAVVMLEYTESLGDLVQILKPVSPGENVLTRGEDFKQGGEVLNPGKELRAEELGALSALGIMHVRVFAKPNGIIFSTGNEVVEPSEKIVPEGKIRDCNAPMIQELCRKKGVSLEYGGILPDDPVIFRKALSKALDQKDFVVLSGGSSVGIRDFTAEILKELSGGELLVEGVTMQPGKPFLLALCRGKPVIGLPGHPVSALSTFLLFGTRILDRLRGKTVSACQPVVRARLARDVPSRPGRTDVIRVQLEQQRTSHQGTEEGKSWVAHPIFGRSGLLHTLTEADGFVMVPPDQEGLLAGQEVEVIIYGINTYE
ncbi:MAG: gephyrin-like molybdotransferase Glp [Spirochaetales bacterium]